ncbi:MAG: DEAD/DEAH box helicase, partial [Methanobacteriota archaeon]
MSTRVCSPAHAHAAGYKVPTPIQRKSLPFALAGRDIVAMARTGSGKTAAFLIPMLEKLKAHSTRIGARAVLLSPTRELALQTMKFAKSLGKFLDLRVSGLVGGESMEEQFSMLANNPDVLVATPGRLMHLLLEVPNFTLKNVEYVVFDEADRLFEMGFAEQLREILSRMPERRQTLLFSATLPKALVQFAKAGLKEPELLRLDTDTKVSENLRLAFFTVRKDDKVASLLWVLNHVIPQEQQAMVFVATKHHTDFLTRLLNACGCSAEPIFGQMDQTARMSNLAKFRSRKTRVLVVTDVAARGIDIPLLDNVINYDFPDRAKLFVHRAGRVARQGRVGTAFSLVAASDLPYMLDFLLFLGRSASNTYSAPAAGSGAGMTDRYTLDSMTAEDVHYGQIPRSAVEMYVERVRDLVAADVDLTAAVKTINNALEAYNKTRAESSRQSVSRARVLVDDKVHPLLLQYAQSNEGALRNFIAGLQAFRPQQTIMELDASHADRAGAVAAVAAKRKVHAHALAPRVGSVSLAVAAAAAARGGLDMSEFGHDLRVKLEHAAAAKDAAAALGSSAEVSSSSSAQRARRRAAVDADAEDSAEEEDADAEDGAGADSSD